MKTSRYIFLALSAFAMSCGGGGDHESPVVKPSSGHSITIGAGYEWCDATRAILNTASGEFWWSAGDQVGLTITPHDSPTPIVHNVPLPGDHDGTVSQTTFSGTLTPTQYAALDPEKQYNYYTYFPYRAGLGGTFPNVRFTLPSVISVRPNEFDESLAPLIAHPQTAPPQVFFSGSTTTYDDLDIHFRYDHVMSYAAIEMDVALMPEPVTSITITSGGTVLSGDLVFDMTYPGSEPSFVWASGGATSIRIDIGEGGLVAGGGDKIYIPMQPGDMSGQTFSFRFTTAGSNSYFAKDIPGTRFERGMIHTLKIAPAAEYKESTAVTITKSGIYYIEAWGGDGGRGMGGTRSSPTNANGAKGGESQKIDGLYRLNEGDVINLYIGTAGYHAGNIGNGAPLPYGGMNGSSYGAGGQGGSGGIVQRFGGQGGGGGAGTFMLVDGEIRMVSGGGGGGGGNAYANTETSGGAGGNGGAVNSNGISGGGGGSGGSGGNGNGAGGAANGDGQDGGAGSITNGNGGYGGKGEDGAVIVLVNYAAGAGGGGGGGGYVRGGGGGGGGRRVVSGRAGGGGGGAGGASYRSDEGRVNEPAPTAHPRANGTNGYMVITPIRE